MDGVKWVTVTETNGITIAEALAERLKAAEIPARAVGEGAAKGYALTVGQLGRTVVMVPAEYLQEAQELLDVEPEPDPEDIIICPQCQAEITLDETEWEQGWIICPKCKTHIDLEELF